MRETIIRYRKVLKELYKKDSITKKYYKHELKWIINKIKK